MKPKLSTEAVSAIIHHLESRASESGPKILGSRLGILINAALAPQNVRDFGGLRVLVQNVLSPYVRSLGLSVETQDYLYEILTPSQAAKRPLQTQQGKQEVAGADLWRFFSNPNVQCVMAVTPLAVVVVAPQVEELPVGSVELARMQPQHYQTWAQGFAEERGLQTQFELCTHAPDFYKAWIPALRKAGATGENLLKSWEILRTEKVAQHLTDELKAAAIEESRIAEIVKVARPVGRPSQSPIMQAPAAHVSHKKYIEIPGLMTISSELTSLRQVLHRAIDVMTLQELKDIRVSAGTWISIIENPNM